MAAATTARAGGAALRRARGRRSARRAAAAVGGGREAARPRPRVRAAAPWKAGGGRRAQRRRAVLAAAAAAGTVFPREPAAGARPSSAAFGSAHGRPGRRGREVACRSILGVGAPEAVMVGVVALIVFGPKGLAEVVRSAARAVRSFQPALSELREVRVSEARSAARAAPSRERRAPALARPPVSEGSRVRTALVARRALCPCDGVPRR